MKERAPCSAAPFALLLAGCGGAQSTLDPAGEGAERIAVLFWQMSAGALVIWLVVVALTLFALFREPGPERAARYGRWMIWGGGVIVPTVLLAGLLSYGLLMLPGLLAAAPPGSPQVEIIGEQYFWRVRYRSPEPGGADIELANELRLPRGVDTQLQLASRDVIHSFWVPALGGKMDMIPGRVTQLRLRPTRSGVLRGVCAEYCGTSHAFMALAVVVLEPADFARWLAAEARPARTPNEGLAAQGAELFAQHGCGACHSVRGTSARGVVGPDLTHVGSRHTLGAGLLGNDAKQFEHFLTNIEDIKPGTSMPHFAMLPAAERAALGAYLEALQ